jgi:hypothetical protein
MQDASDIPRLDKLPARDGRPWPELSNGQTQGLRACTGCVIPPGATSLACQLAAPSPPGQPSEQPIEPIPLKFLRTLCGLRGVTPLLTCANAPIHTLKRNSTTSPSAIT